MELCQLVVGNFELHATRRIGFNQVDEIPGNFARGHPQQQRAQSRSRNHALQQPPNRAARANVHSSNLQLRTAKGGVLMKIDVIDAHNFAAINVNHLLIEQVAAKEQQAFRAVGQNPVSSDVGRAHTTVNI